MSNSPEGEMTGQMSEYVEDEEGVKYEWVRRLEGDRNCDNSERTVSDFDGGVAWRLSKSDTVEWNE
jgi:hypothetical protein